MSDGAACWPPLALRPLAEGTISLARQAESAWRAIEAVRSPGPAGPAPMPPLRRLASRSLLRWPAFVAGASLTFVAASIVLRLPFGALGLLGLWALRPGAEERRRRQKRQRGIRECENELLRLQSLWGLHCGDAGFLRRRRDLDAARRSLQALPELEEQERRHLGARVSERALERRQLRRRESLASVLQEGVSDLRRCRQAVLARRSELRSEIEREAARLAALSGEAP